MMDFSEQIKDLTDAQLRELLVQIEARRTEMARTERREATRQLREIFEQFGFTEDEVIKVLHGCSSRASATKGGTISAHGAKISAARKEQTAARNQWFNSLPLHSQEAIEAFKAMPKAGKSWISQDGSKTWEGKGPYPNWLLRHIAAGGDPATLEA